MTEKETEDAKSGEDDRSESRHLLSRRTVMGVTAVGIAGGLPAISTAESSSFTAVNDGNWSDPTTWQGGSVPTDGSDVVVQDGVTVTVASRVSARVKHVDVAGALRFAPDRNTKLRAETIETRPGSRFEVGTASNPVQPDVTAEVEVVDHGPINEDKWPDRRNKGLLLGGTVRVHGAEKTPWTELGSHPVAGDTTLELPSEPTNWNVGDEIVVPGVEPYSDASLAEADQHEERTVADVSGTTVTLDSALDYDHVPPRDHLDAYVLNLTRNVTMFSENTDEHRRGHLMIMGQASDLRYVRLHEMGRTNKDQPITNPVRNADQVDATDPNPAARYSLHWHRTGADATEPHVVEGAVVDRNPGWGIVNHHAYARVTDSVTYDVFGSGFVAEGGNERGSYERCFACKSTGSGETIDSRSAGQSGHGGDPPIDDFGHAGHGFWSQSPLVEMVDNVAAGHRHQAFVYWTRPLLDKHEETLAEATPSTIADSRVSYVPNTPMEWLEGQEPMLEAIEQGRFGNEDEWMWDTQKVNSSFVRLRRVEGNTAFASAGGLDFSRNQFKWQHERFSDFSVIDGMTVHGVGPFIDADGEIHEPDPPKHLSSGHQGRGGNVGVSFRYTTNVSLVNSELYGGGTDNGFAVPYHDYLWTSTVDDCTIEDWDWGVATGEHRLTWIRNNSFDGNGLDVHWSFDNAGPAILDGNDLNLVRNKFQRVNEKATEVFSDGQGDGVRIDGRSLHVNAAEPDFVPFPDSGSLGGVNHLDDVFSDPSALVGLTSQEIWDQYGEAIGGHLMPDDAVAKSYLDGCKLGPASRTPPTSVALDAVDADSMGAFEVVDEQDASGGSAVRTTGGDTPLQIPFECAAGTYHVYLRVWPDAWNGDTVSVRVDGGEWKDAEKLKTPVGFQWHDASPNGGEKYTWDLSEGTHTLEVACGNDGVYLDEVFVTSDAEVLGAYGQSTQTTSGTDSGSTGDLVGHWEFEETSGEVVDSTGNGLDGTNRGGTRGVAGIDGNAIEFDGSSYVDLPDDSRLPSGDETYTLSAWFKTARDHEGGLVGWGDYSNCNHSNAIRVTGLGASDEVSFKHFWWCDDLTADTAVAYDDAWHHVAATYDGTTREIWLDGQRVAADTPGDNDAAVANAAIGLTDEEYFRGRIDEVRVYDRSLDDSEIASLYDAHSGGTTAPTAPTNLTASDVTASSVDLGWDAASDSDSALDHYNVYRDGSKTTAVGAGTTATTVSGLAAGTTYDFYITAVDADGNESDPSNTVTVTTVDKQTVTVTGDGLADYNDGSDVRYIVETDGRLEAKSGLESVDVSGGSKASGRVPGDGSDSDTYVLYDGTVTDVSTFGGDVTVTVDGTTV